MRLTLRLIMAGAAVPMLAAAQVPVLAPPKMDVRPKIVDELPRKMELDVRFELEHQASLLEHQASLLAHLDMDRVKLNADQVRLEVEAMKNMPYLEAPLLKAERLSEMKFEAMALDATRSDRLISGRPRSAWAHEDPADSLYRTAREALNRGEYRRAAQLFNEVTRKFPKSVYALDCAYWEAFSRYRAGSTDDLKAALKILDEGRVTLTQLRSDNNVDVQALRARVQGALAARGDQQAADDLRKEAAQSSGCDREEISVRAEALSALGQMDMTTAMPVVKKVLARRDECTVELRRRALYLLGRQADAEAANVILDVAKNDNNPDIRGEAIRWLPRVAGDNAVPQLEELLRTSTDEQFQRAAINALASIDTERARRALRTIIERPDAAERIRYDAILSLSREREGRSTSPEEMTYLRSLYRKMESPKLREAVLTSASRLENAENAQFLMTIARDVNEQTSLRSSALQRLGRMQSVSAAEISKLYEVADARSLREGVLFALSQRKEPEAIDKMMEVVKKDTDPNIRRTAISLLMRSNNERAKKFLAEMIDK